MVQLSLLDTLALAEACARYAGTADIAVSSYDLPLERGRVLLPPALMQSLADGINQVLNMPEVAGTAAARALMPTIRNLQAALDGLEGYGLEMRADDYRAFTQLVSNFLERHRPDPATGLFEREEAYAAELEESASLWIQEGQFLVHADDYGQLHVPVLASTYRKAQAFLGSLDLLQLYADRIGMLEMAAVVDALRQHAMRCGHILDAAGHDPADWLMGVPEDCAQLVAQMAAFQSLFDELPPDDRARIGGDRAAAALADVRDLATCLKQLPVVNAGNELIVHRPVAWWRRALDGLAPFLADYRAVLPFDADDQQDYDRVVQEISAILVEIPLQTIPEDQ